MTQRMVHRGPDDEGFLHVPEFQLGMGMRRLSIIDLEHGQQPFSNENDDVWVFCNGEIYNSPSLRKTLLARGHVFRSHNSDVEVLVHLYEEYGKGMLTHLNGMFAFVILDKRKGELFGARDRLGIKPLYLYHYQGRFAYASELKSLLTLNGLDLSLDRQSVSDYLSYQFIPAPGTPYLHIRKLGAGEHFTYRFRDNSLSLDVWWKATVCQGVQLCREDWLRRVREQMELAVDRWTLSDVPIGVSLSGGLDSSALVGLLHKAGHEQLKTFSIGFDGNEFEAYDERDLARQVARRYHTDHLEIRVDATRVLEDLDSMVYHLDEPYGGGLPSWYVYESMAGRVKVGLTGTGGDELFGNYGKASKYLRAKSIRAKRVLAAVLKGDFSKAKYLWQYPNAGASWLFLRNYQKGDYVLSRDFLAHTVPTERKIEEYWNSSAGKDPRDVILQLDFPNQLAEEFLMVTDRFSMAHGVEARVPLLDHELVELVLGMPPDIRVGKESPKQFMRDLVGDLLPPDLLHAKKRGFVLPLTEWTRTALRDRVVELLSPNRLEAQGIFNPDLYRRFVLPHLDGTTTNTMGVWTLFMFQLWYEAHSGGAP